MVVSAPNAFELYIDRCSGQTSEKDHDSQAMINDLNGIDKLFNEGEDVQFQTLSLEGV